MVVARVKGDEWLKETNNDKISNLSYIRNNSQLFNTVIISKSVFGIVELKKFSIAQE